MAVQLAEVSDRQIEALVSEIEKTGFATIPGYIDSETLSSMQGFVADAVSRSAGEYVAFTGPESVSGSAFGDLGANSSFRAIIERVFEVGTGQKPPRQEFYQVLRCLTGRGSKKNSFLFHYDSYVVTALIPVQIPSTGLRGDLLMLPNTRRIRGRYISNVIDKIILDNALSQFLLRKLFAWGWLKVTKIRMVPGNLYLFWGYRSIHTNEDCDPDKVRATALYHFGNPHAETAWSAARGSRVRQAALNGNVVTQ